MSKRETVYQLQTSRDHGRTWTTAEYLFRDKDACIQNGEAARGYAALCGITHRRGITFTEELAHPLILALFPAITNAHHNK